MSMDINAFSQTFFDEADELLANMEQHLLELDPQAPDIETLNAIFRAAHSIKGGAATFGFKILQETTHLLENLLDDARRQEMKLSTEIINLFLETKDIMQEQLDAYKSSQEPDAESYEYICKALRQLAEEAQREAQQNGATGQAEQGAGAAPPAASESTVRVCLSKLKEKEVPLMLEELGHLGEIKASQQTENSLDVTLDTTASKDEISSVLCFVVEPEQITFPALETTTPPAAAAAQPAPAASAAAEAKPAAAATPSPAPAATAAEKSPEPAHPEEHPASIEDAAATAAATAAALAAKSRANHAHAKNSEATNIRVAVEKIDQLVNLVGELVITQSMLAQRSGDLDPVIHGELINSMGQLERNARDLQESVMSIRMMPMEFVFSRFPRLVRDLAGKLNKQVELTLLGSSTELDKSLSEHIIDPLTHLVRNSLDHGIEPPEVRIAAGKPACGNLTLSAEHQGGNICIEVTDDGAGLNREKILAKATAQGMAVHENMTDAEVAMLIFAPGFSTAEKVTEVSGRGVGMDVVKRNIQEMGGHVEVHFRRGKGTTIRILLPLTLAILDGMSVRVKDEVFILPLNAVMESLQPKAEDLHPVAGGEQVLQVRGEYLPLVELCHVFDVAGAKTDATQGIVVILQTAGRRYALLVDQLIGQHQVVVKNLESNYRKVPGISAATILGDGSVALIVDVSALQTLNKEKLQTHEELKSEATV